MRLVLNSSQRTHCAQCARNLVRGRAVERLKNGHTAADRRATGAEGGPWRLCWSGLLSPTACRCKGSGKRLNAYVTTVQLEAMTISPLIIIRGERNEPVKEGQPTQPWSQHGHNRSVRERARGFQRVPLVANPEVRDTLGHPSMTLTPRSSAL